MNAPLVSVIIPSFNSSGFIDRCLESLQKQTYRHIEVIVVDNKSTDDTIAIAKKYTSKIFTAGHERSAQFNYGAHKARGKYLYRVDSDFIVEPEVISQCVQKCEKDRLDGIAVHNTSADNLGFWAEVRKYERNCYVDDNLIVAVRFFTKTAWEKIGGFDETLYGPEDYDFHIRFTASGFRFGRIEAREYHLGEPKTLKDIWKKHFFYGKQMVAYFRKHPDIASKQLNPVRRGYFRHFDKLFKHPGILLGLVIMTAVKFTAGGSGFVWSYLTGYDPLKNALPASKTKLLYSGLGWAGLFTKIRFWTGSFAQIEKYVPKSGKILDLGCGYGIFGNFLALSSSEREVLGIDNDNFKIRFADRGIANARFSIGDATKIRLPGMDCVLLLDVLHHLDSYKDQEKLIKDCKRMLNKNGLLIISEVDSKPLWKLIFARLTDFVLYKGQKVYYRYKNTMLPMLKKSFSSVKVEVLLNNPFPHLLYICKK